jgi:hypothetical protein
LVISAFLVQLETLAANEGTKILPFGTETRRALSSDQP